MLHLDRLCEVGLDPELWKYTSSGAASTEQMRDYIAAALDAMADGTALPFVIVEKATDTVVGSTRYANIDRRHRKLEIGWTWLAKPFQRTAVNSTAKFLMLRHAFEVLGCIRVELKTDVLNTRSRSAILRIGAREEGVLRHHMITDAGRVRDTVFFSVLDREWPEVKARLEARLDAP